MRLRLIGEVAVVKMNFAVDFCLIAILAGVAVVTHTAGDKKPAARRSDSVHKAVTQVLINLQKDGRTGSISRQKLVEAVEAEFDRLDRDRNGNVDSAEIRRSQAWR